MTHEEIHKVSDDIHSGIKMMLEKVAKASRDAGVMDLCEMMNVTDMIKDLSEAHKNIVKVHWMLSEKPIRKY